MELNLALNLEFVQYRIRYSLGNFAEPSLVTFEVEPRFEILPSNQKFFELRTFDDEKNFAGIQIPVIVAQICAVFNETAPNCDRAEIDWTDEKKFPVLFRDFEKDWEKLSQNSRGGSSLPILRLGNFRQGAENGAAKKFANFFFFCLIFSFFLF